MSAAGQNMNCSDYREAIAADPSESFDGGAAHASACVSCSSYREEMRAFNEKIALALSIDVPALQMPELPPIDADSNVVNLPFARRRPLTMPVWIGIAASFAIAVVFGARFLGGEIEQYSLADEIIAHLDHEPTARHEVVTPVSTLTLNTVVSSDVADLGGVGLVTFAWTCIIHGKKVPHLIIQGKRGPITLLLMPDEEVDVATTLQGIGIKGVILPIGRGSIAIIGERDELLEDFERQVIDSVKWSI